MKMMRVTEVAQVLVRAVIEPGDDCVDATVGNGHETCMLAEAVGGSGRVFGFDVQQAALRSTAEVLEQRGLRQRVGLFEACHSGLAEHVASGSVAAVMFNLGYLPGGDHECTTTAATTLAALDAGLQVLRPGGVLSVVVYPGHAAGAEEDRALRSWLAVRAGQHCVATWEVARREAAPWLAVVQI